MKYKIQIPSLGGWADYKFSEDDGETYSVELFQTIPDAESEMNSILEFIPDFEGRIVSEDTQPEYDIY